MSGKEIKDIRAKIGVSPNMVSRLRECKFRIVKIVSLTFAFLLLLSSCEDGDKIGKYLYLTDNGALHCDKNCKGIRNGKDKKGHEVYGMKFLDTLTVGEHNLYYFCKSCFNDESYEHVQRILRRNQEVIHQGQIMTDNKSKNRLEVLYDALVADGVSNDEDYDSFKSRMLASGDEGYKNRYNLWKSLHDADLINSKTYEEFRDKLNLTTVRCAQGAK